MWKQRRYFPPLRTERGGKKNGVLPFLFLERAACRRLFRGAVKGILDQSQRRIKTSAPHFTSISPTLLEHCASAVEVNKGRLFVSASHSNDPFYLSLFFSSSTSPRLFFVSPCHSTVPPLWLLHRLDPNEAHAAPSQSASCPANSLWHLHMYSSEVQGEEAALSASHWPPFPSSVTLLPSSAASSRSHPNLRSSRSHVLWQSLFIKKLCDYF